MLLEVLSGSGAMTADQSERQIEAMQDILILYPADLLELIAFVAEEQAEGQSTAIGCPNFPMEEV